MNVTDSNRSQNLDQAIVKTVAYFSLFRYPLTLIELGEYLQGASSPLSQILARMRESDWLKERVEESQGFIFLKGKKEDVELRLSRYALADRKIKKVRRALRVIASLPSVRGIMLCNNISQLNSSAESDIDLFLVVRDGWMWVTRFVLLAVTELMGVRIHGEDAKDKLCLSFFISDASLDLSAVALAEGDVYLQYWLETLMPIYDAGAYAALITANKRLLGNSKNARNILTSRYSIVPVSFLRPVFGGILWVLRPFAVLIERFQWNSMSPQKRSLAASQGTEVVINGSMLKFHDNDRRWLYLQRWRGIFQTLCSTKK